MAVVSVRGLLVSALLAVALLAARPTGSAQAVGIDSLVATAPSVQPQGRHVTVTVRVGAAEVVSARARGTIHQGGHDFPLRAAKASVAGGRTARLELRPRKRWQERRIHRALARGKRLRATVRIRFHDLLGSTATRTISITLT